MPAYYETAIPRGLHQFRVDHRGLEVALKCFGEAFEQPWLEELRGRAEVLSHRLGPARDLNIFLKKLFLRPAKAFTGEDESEMFALLGGEAEVARDAAWKEDQRLRCRRRFRGVHRRCRVIGSVAPAAGAGPSLGTHGGEKCWRARPRGPKTRPRRPQS